MDYKKTIEVAKKKNPTRAEILGAAQWMHDRMQDRQHINTAADEVFRAWREFQRNLDNLFLIHGYIESLMHRLAKVARFDPTRGHFMFHGTLQDHRSLPTWEETRNKTIFRKEHLAWKLGLLG